LEGNAKEEVQEEGGDEKHADNEIIVEVQCDSGLNALP
jgi:hypothetical protein